MRKFLILAIPLLLLAGCERPIGGRNYAPLLMDKVAAPPGANDNTAFSFMHSLTLEMQRQSVEPRYERGREQCLQDAQLGCKLLSSSLEKSEGAYSSYNAQLIVALPHNKVASYEHDVAAPLAGEATADVAVRSRSTTAQNVSLDANSAHRKVAQLSDYRDRLQALAKRPNLSVDDLIKVESELSKAQSDLDDALSQKGDIDDRVQREQVSIYLNERAEPEGLFGPISAVWNQSMGLLGESAASALQFLIQIIPWLPLIIAGLFLVRWVWRIARRRNSVANSRSE